MRALARAAPYMDIKKWKLLLDAFFSAQLNYCPLIWILHSRCNNNNIKYFHGRSVRLFYNGKNSSYDELLQKEYVNHKSIEELATEMLKVKNAFAPEIEEDVESNGNYYTLQKQSDTTHLPQHL